MTVTTWLAVEPLDTIMVRDGRSLVAGTGSVAQVSVPPPTTLGGVVHAALGDPQQDPQYLLGPLVYAGGHVLFPSPADVVRDDHRIGRLAVRQRSAREHTDLDDTYRCTHGLFGNGTPTQDWLTGAGLAAWLAQDKAQPYAFTDEECRDWLRPPPWQPEARAGLARHWDGELAGTAASGMFYETNHLRPDPDMRFLVGCVDRDPVRVARQVVPLGGRGRLATVQPATTFIQADPLPAPPHAFPGGRVAVYLATPALLDNVLWRPPDTAARLSALALTGRQPIASASRRLGIGQTRQLLWAVPAGTVFYLTFDDETLATEWAHRCHGRLLPGSRVPDGAARPEILNAGFGICLTGRW